MVGRWVRLSSLPLCRLMRFLAALPAWLVPNLVPTLGLVIAFFESEVLKPFLAHASNHLGVERGTARDDRQSAAHHLPPSRLASPLRPVHPKLRKVYRSSTELAAIHLLPLNYHIPDSLIPQTDILPLSVPPHHTHLPPVSHTCLGSLR